MAETTAIEWADATFNPWIGCTKVSPACDHCYAEHVMDHRLGRVKWGGARQRTSPAYWRQPLKWNAAAAAAGKRRTVFCASLADVWDNQVPNDWRADLFNLIDATPHLTWLLLSKRIGNAVPMVREWDWRLPKNVGLGATMANQPEWERDSGKLSEAASRLGAAFTFASVEPMLGPIDAGGQLPDWVIVGGESGPKARPTHPDWARSLRDQCAAAGVPFFFKQWGEWASAACLISTGEMVFRQFHDFQHWVNKASTWVRGGICLDKNGTELRIGADFMKARDEGLFPVTIMHRVGKKAAGRLLDGVEHNGFPKVIA